ncbi:MAG: cysteine methyltransferase [Candidatus Marinimicrobia bacterium]|nr:cysteine methyltransferase [Candidatus Neomarinimicrobiota bacterium]
MKEFARINTLIGTLGIQTNEKGVYRLYLENKIDKNKKETPKNKRSFILQNALNELKEYFEGEKKSFNVPLELEIPRFYKKVLLEVAKVPFGETVSYKEIAKRVGNEKACRAVGSANANNPIAVFIPCHRILASDGTLGGYGGGLDKKMILLRHEGINLNL